MEKKKNEALEIFETFETEKQEQLTKLALIFSTEELEKILKRVSDPKTRKLILSYI